MKFTNFTTLALAAVLTLASCGKENTDFENKTPGDGNTEKPLPAVRKNCIVENGVESEIGTTFVRFLSNRLCFVVSSDKMDDMGDLPQHDNYTVSVLPTLLGTKFDLKSETTTYSVTRYSAKEEDYDIYVSPYNVDETRSGTCRVVLDETKKYAVLDLSLTQEDGTTISVYDSLACDLVLPSASVKNYYWSKVGGVEAKKPINSAFYQKTDNGYVNIYLTPGAIDYFDELDATTSYVCLSVLDGKMPVGEQNIQTTTVQFVLLYRTQEGDYIQNPLTVQLYNDDNFGRGIDNYTGTFSVAKGEKEGEYSVSINVSGEVGLDILFNGVCKSSEITRQIPNEFVYNKKATKINSVIVDKISLNTVDVWLTGESGVTDFDGMQKTDCVHIAGFPSTKVGSAENESPWGFSLCESLMVMYAGNTWNYANGDSGTVTITDLGDDIYYIKFLNYADFSLEWRGKATVVSEVEF